MSAKLRTLLFSTLYPSSVRPGHGQFVETRLRELLKSDAVDTRVVAPVPWFWSTSERWGDYARVARTPRRETRHGIQVLHPRYLLPPKVGQTVAPAALALGALPTLRALMAEGFDFDLIDAHYFYPDGVAAAWLGAVLGKPVVVTARGSDLNVLGRYPAARRMMRWAAGRAGASIGVCTALVDILRGWGVAEERLHVVRNGVDLQRFQPLERAASRQQLGVQGAPLLLSVGNLVEVKGHALTIDALALLAPRHPGARLYLVGQGPLRESLESHARLRGVQDLVHFVGAVPNEQLAAWYGAADASVLASRSEGWANVLLESMACGTPVVATDVGGSAEVLGSSGAGRLLSRRDAPCLAQALTELVSAPPERARVRQYAEGFSWDASSAAQLALFRQLVDRSRAAAAMPGARPAQRH